MSTPAPAGDAHLSLTEVHALCMGALLRHRVSERQARAIADNVTGAERDVCRTHGLFRIPGYCASATSGKADGTAEPVLHELAPAVLQVDAGRGFAPLALQVGLGPLAERAAAQGIAALAITRCHHFAALWPEVEYLAGAGLIGFAFTAAHPYVAPAGGIKPLYGTNPMAFSWPRADGRPPVVFDQAASASARGEIQLHLRDGKRLPPGWAIDVEGRPTTDPGAALAGAQLPFGGYKGAAIALMVELLAGALIGDLLSFESAAGDNGDGGPPSGGEFLLAIDPARCGAPGGRAGAMAHAELLFEQILGQPGTRLPSDRRYAARQRSLREGVQVARVLYDELLALQGD